MTRQAPLNSPPEGGATSATLRAQDAVWTPGTRARMPLDRGDRAGGGERLAPDPPDDVIRVKEERDVDRVVRDLLADCPDCPRPFANAPRCRQDQRQQN